MPADPAAAPAAEICAATAELQPRHSPDPLEQLLQVPRAGRCASGRPSCGSTFWTNLASRRRRRPGDRAGQARGKRAGVADLCHGRSGADAAAGKSQATDSARARNAPPVGRRRGRISAALVIHRARASAVAGRGTKAWPRNAIDRFILARLEARACNHHPKPIGPRSCAA